MRKLVEEENSIGSNIEKLVEAYRDAINVRRVFGEPYEKNAVTMIPAAKVMGGGGHGHRRLQRRPAHRQHCSGCHAGVVTER